MTATGAQAAADTANVRSPETYVGYERAENFVSPGGAVQDAAHDYAAGDAPRLNEWALAGDWTIGRSRRALNRARTAASSTASTRATCISCSAPRPTASRCASA